MSSSGAEAVMSVPQRKGPSKVITMTKEVVSHYGVPLNLLPDQ